MKKISFLLLVVVGICACKDEPRGQYPTDSTAPAPLVLSSVEVENTPGGAVISYDIPKDEDALYVKAVYSLDNGTPMEIKASVFTDRLTIEGIGRSREVDVAMTVVDRSRNESAPVHVKTNPLDSPIYDIMSSMVVKSDFGGIFLTWDNPATIAIIVDVLSPDKDDNMIQVDRFYSKAEQGKSNVRNQPSTETVFAVRVSDRWGNETDIFSDTYLPLFEEQLDKSKFRRWNPAAIPYNAYTSTDWYIENLWDGTITKGFANYTLEFTFDIGQLAKLSRFRFNQRGGNLCYSYGHPKRFQLWGSTTTVVSADFNDWQYIGDFESVKPSGLPLGEVSDEDLEYAQVKGEEWNVDSEAPALRYIRFVAQETWGQAALVQMMELTMYGSPR